jgi:hypothetical protein
MGSQDLLLKGLVLLPLLLSILDGFYEYIR